MRLLRNYVYSVGELTINGEVICSYIRFATVDWFEVNTRDYSRFAVFRDNRLHSYRTLQGMYNNLENILCITKDNAIISDNGWIANRIYRIKPFEIVYDGAWEFQISLA